MREFSGRTAVITGAAGGFGLEFAKRAALLGMRVVLADVEAGALQRAHNLVESLGARVISQLTDVADPIQVQALADRAFAEFAGVHLLFNNAGVAPVGLVWEHTAQDWQWALSVNVLGIAHGLRSFVPRMLEQSDDSHIINTASVAGYLSPTGMGLYNVTKHAVVTMSETLHHDLRAVGSNIGVTVLSPAFVPTGIANSERNRPDHLRSEERVSEHTRRARESMLRAVSSGRLTAEDIASLTFAAIAERRFYLFTHPAILPSVKARHDAIAALAEPSDPFALRPALAPALAGNPAK
jgi:NAD(P)-dependent dehydrogenase (short-subunit alcohol dehydrogenase family)